MGARERLSTLEMLIASYERTLASLHFAEAKLKQMKPSRDRAEQLATNEVSRDYAKIRLARYRAALQQLREVAN